MSIKQWLVRFHWLLADQFGLDPRRLALALRGVGPYLRDLFRFRRACSARLTLLPCLHDRYEEAGTTRNEYFWQDLLVARRIHARAPEIHVDVGSRIDGFVAHVASFREIEVFDVRPMSSSVPGIRFRQADLMHREGLPVSGDGYCDSLSCLHALEHFGLGRYGDPIDPSGYAHGMTNMAALLKAGGVFYLSTPIGRQRVVFNANWVFDPRTLVGLADRLGLDLVELIVIGGEAGPRQVDPDENTLNTLAAQDYNLGLFIFVKRTP